MEALELINSYSFSTIVRCVAINNVMIRSGLTAGLDLVTLSSDKDKLLLFKQTSIFQFDSNKVINIKKIEILKANRKVVNIGIWNVIDRVLQTQLSVLLKIYFEAKYNKSDMFNFGKENTCLQAVNALEKIIDHADKDCLGLAILNIEGYLNNIQHDTINKIFKVPHI